MANGYGRQFLFIYFFRIHKKNFNSSLMHYNRLFHSDGDIFIGEWKDDKSNGLGKYIHVNLL